MLAATWHVLRQRKRYDLAVSSSHYIFDSIPTLCANASMKCVYWHHHTQATATRPEWLTGLIRATEKLTVMLIAWTGSRVLTGSDATRQWLVQQGLSEIAVRMTTNHTSLRTKNEAPPSQAEQRAMQDLTGTKFALFFARLSKTKGTDDLAAIWRDVLGMSQNVRLVICGNGPEEAALEGTLSAPSLSRSVLLLGFVSESTKEWLFANAHVLLFPSREEGWGLTVADALECGCHVVAYDLPAMRAVSPEGPRYVPVGDRAAFLREVLACLEAPRPGSSPRSGPTWDEIARNDLEAVALR